MTSKPALRATEATRRQALRLAARALAVAEQVLRAERREQPERKPPSCERGLRVIAGRQSA